MWVSNAQICVFVDCFWAPNIIHWKYISTTFVLGMAQWRNWKKTQKASLSFPAGQLKALKNSKRSNSCLKGWWCRNIAWPKYICISSCAFTCEISNYKILGEKIFTARRNPCDSSSQRQTRVSKCLFYIMIYIYIILHHSCSPCSPEARPGLPGKPLRSSPFLTVGEQMTSKSKFLK